MSTNNFIFNFSDKKKSKEKNHDKNYASQFRRSVATLVDIHITLIVRAIFLQIVFSLIFNNLVNNFLNDFESKFGTRSPKSTPEHIEFVMNHPILIYTILLIIATIFVGAFYHAYFNSSNWQATIGKRLMAITISSDHQKISFWRGLYHYFLTTIPYAYILFLLVYIRKNNYELYEVFTKEYSVTFVGIVVLIATHMGAFNKRKINFFDYLADVEFFHEKTKTKFFQK